MNRGAVARGSLSFFLSLFPLPAASVSDPKILSFFLLCLSPSLSQRPSSALMVVAAEKLPVVVLVGVKGGGIS